LLRKIVIAVILVPLAIVIIAFAVANRQIVTVSFDPFTSAEPAASMTLPLFALIILLLVIGVLIGGVAAWLRQGKWRTAARRLELKLHELQRKIDALGGTADGPPVIPERTNPPERLKLKPPLS